MTVIELRNPVARQVFRDFGGPRGRPRKDDIPETYPKGRRCMRLRCITQLSIYNHGPFCFLHAQQAQSLLENENVERIDFETLMAEPEAVAA